MSRVIRWIVCALLLALAPLLLFHAQANTNLPSGPLLSTNGFNLAELARAGLRVRKSSGATTVVVAPQALELARQAFALEPQAGNALFVLAVDERAGDANGTGGQALLNAAVELNRRNRFLGALQLEKFSRRGDFANTFAVIDRLSMVYPELTAEFVQPLAQSLRQDDALDVLANALSGDPVWADDFWLAVPSEPVLVDRMYALRQRVDNGTSKASDAQLMGGLVGAGRFDDAIAFRDSQIDGPIQRAGQVSLDGDPPFGWELAASGELAMTQRGNGGYEVFVQQDTSGVLGQQLLVLSSGRYTLSATVAPLSSSENLVARLQCATSPNLVAGNGALDEPVVFSVPAGCKGWWLKLTGDAWNLRDGLRASLHDIRFEAVR